MTHESHFRFSSTKRMVLTVVAHERNGLDFVIKASSRSILIMACKITCVKITSMLVKWLELPFSRMVSCRSSCQKKYCREFLVTKISHHLLVSWSWSKVWIHWEYPCLEKKSPYLCTFWGQIPVPGCRFQSFSIFWNQSSVKKAATEESLRKLCTQSLSSMWGMYPVATELQVLKIFWNSSLVITWLFLLRACIHGGTPASLPNLFMCFTVYGKNLKYNVCMAWPFRHENFGVNKWHNKS